MKKHVMEMTMAVLLLISVFFLSKEAAVVSNETAEKEKVIVIDAGHGGADPGMIGIGGLEEKGINLAVSMKLKEALENQGFTVVMTRQEDKGLYEEGTRNKKVQDMQNRIKIMEKAKPILAVSIHQNSYTEESVKGPQVFYYETSAEGQKLAVNIQNALNTELSTERPRKEKGNTSYFLLKKSPCVLNIVECGFLTNKKEAELLQTEEYQQRIVEAVVKGIVQYIEGK
ncbi:MAG: N-acetylmuramoyl-L-alanine amidase [Eubacteriales bacterium]|nr:N-acetylmuramoyl-L-alanine amidase [Eubacteriales bacterium]